MTERTAVATADQKTRKVKRSCPVQLTTDERLGTLLANGYEFRDVECIETTDFATGMVTIERVDNGEMVQRRPARPEELQPELELSADNE